MDDLNQKTVMPRGKGLIAASVILGLALVAAAGISAYGRVESKRDEFSGASFYGKARREVESDKAKLSLTLNRYASSTEEAVKLLEKDREALREAVSSAGVTDAEYSYHQVQPDRYGYNSGDYEMGSYRPVKYYAAQTIVIESGAAAAALGEFGQQAAVNMSKDGLHVTAERIEFNYSKLDELERELLREAIKDAKDQATEILGRQFGRLRSFDRPTLSVRPINGDDFNYYGGRRDNTSLKKEVEAAVYVTYTIK